MRLKLIIFCSSLLINLLIVLFSAKPSLAVNEPTLEDIHFESVSDTKEQVIFKLSGDPVPVIFAIKGENPRIVFDFPNTSPAITINTNIDVDGHYVKKIRVGFHKDEEPKTRVVFDLYPEKLVDIDKVFHQEDKTLVVTIRPQNASQEQETKEPQTSVQEESVGEKEITSPDVSKEVEEKITATPQTVQVQEPSPEPNAEKPEIPEIEETNTDEQVPFPEEQVDTAPDTDKKEATPLLSSIKFDKTSNRGEMLLFELNDFYPPVVFGIEEKLPRVVCDFMDTKVAKSVPSIIDCNGKYLKTVRVGIHNKPVKVRVVLDLAPENNYDLQQVFFKEDNLFVLIINKFQEEEKEPEKTNVKPRRGDRLNSF